MSAQGREAPAGLLRQIDELTAWSAQCRQTACREEVRRIIRAIQSQIRRAQTYKTNEERDVLRKDILVEADNIDTWAKRYGIVPTNVIVEKR